MKYVVMQILVGAMVAQSIGCGGTSQDDMRKFAISRSRDSENDAANDNPATTEPPASTAETLDSNMPDDAIAGIDEGKDAESSVEVESNESPMPTADGGRTDVVPDDESVASSDAAVTPTREPNTAEATVAPPAESVGESVESIANSKDEPVQSVAITSESPAPKEIEGTTDVESTAAVAEQSTTVVAAPRELGLTRLPSASDRESAKRQFQEAYGEEYSAARDTNERLKLARRLFAQRTQVSNHAASYFVLLDIVRQIAVQAGNVDLALESLDAIAERFVLTDSDINESTLRGLSKNVTDVSANQKLMKLAENLAISAYQTEDYPRALEFCVLGVTSSRRANDAEAFQRLSWKRKLVEHAIDSQKRADQAFATLSTSPDDPAANEALGRYLCFVRHDWQNGLPILAKASNSQLASVASSDEQPMPTADQQLATADAWWEASQRADLAERDAMRARAVYWYERALPDVKAGFVRLKVQKRLAEVNNGTGSQATGELD